MCDLSGRLFDVPPVTMGDHVRRRVVQKEPAWRIAPANPLTPSHDPTTHIGTSLEGREPRQQAPRARSDRVFSVSEHVWVSMGTGRVDRWKFGSLRCAISRCPGEGNTRSDAPTWRRQCRRAKNTLE